MTYNPEYHHRHSIRLKDYDYREAGAYFITICSYKKQCLFGRIASGQMQLNILGNLVKRCWSQIPNHFCRVRLDMMTIMPNHIHGIIILNENHRRGTARRAPETKQAGTTSRIPTSESFGKPISDSISTIIRSFKGAATKMMNQAGTSVEGPIWQRGYYERVIRNEKELAVIRKYISGNIQNWEMDKDFLR